MFTVWEIVPLVTMMGSVAEAGAAASAVAVKVNDPVAVSCAGTETVTPEIPEGKVPAAAVTVPLKAPL
jgi:hypothetical protein